MIRVLFIGDIVGRLGRATTKKILPSLKESLRIDLCIANGENLAGGRGLTKEKVLEVISYGVDLFTGGDHTFWNKQFLNEIEPLPVLRCLNLKNKYPGQGKREVRVAATRLLVVSVLGSASSFIKEEAENPFNFLDQFLAAWQEKYKVILIDFHAELTSEKVALGWFVDGRVGALMGTHSHVPTSDARILPAGTAYVTDLGMVGSSEGVLGVKKEIIIDRFRKDDRRPFKWLERGRAVFNSVLVGIDERNGGAVSIERIDRVVE